MLSERKDRPELLDKRDIVVGDYYRLLLTIKFLRLLPKFGLAEHKLDDLIDRALASPWLYGSGRAEDFDGESFLANLKHDGDYIMERDVPEPPKAARFEMPPKAVLDKMTPEQKLRASERDRLQKLADRAAGREPSGG